MLIIVFENSFEKQFFITVFKKYSLIFVDKSLFENLKWF